jgi:hypothetical protein
MECALNKSLDFHLHLTLKCEKEVKTNGKGYEGLSI